VGEVILPYFFYMQKNKRIVLKPRKAQHGRPRQSQVSHAQYSSNWDKIFGAKKDDEQKQDDEK
jgi:hypothetical protein